MRFTAGLVTATFASLATASSSSSATVRQYNNPSGPEHPVAVSAAEASLGLAELVGVTKLYTLGVQSSNDDRRLELVEKLAGSEGLFEDRSAQLVVSLVGDLKDGRPVMLIDNSPSADAAEKLVKELAKSRASLSWSTGTLHDVYFSSPKGRCVATVPVEAKFAEAVTIISKLEDVYKSDPADQEFLSEYVYMKNVIDRVVSKVASENGATFCNLQAIQDLIDAHGFTSPQVQYALSLYNDLFKSTSVRTTVLQSPPGASAGDYSVTPLQKRRAPTETPLSLYAKIPQEPTENDSKAPTSKPATSPISPANKSARFERCHPSVEVCTSATNSCNSHGTCKKTTGNCFACVCEPNIVKDKAGVVLKRTHWAGATCKKKDISVPFNLLLFFAITIVLVVVWAISLLFSIGEESLPSVLSAGVAPVKRD